MQLPGSAGGRNDQNIAILEQRKVLRGLDGGAVAVGFAEFGLHVSFMN